MLRRRRGLGGSIDDVATTRDFALPSTPGTDKASEETGIHDNTLIRPSAHNPSRIGYSEENGIQQVFLILREHLGDENLDLAGGVLYELIEIDCEHSDDHGAAFQRWRHDHMCRYADLELPHIPHMTTITSSIIPTDRLTRWRFQHPERYPFVLSDSSPSSQRLSFNASCIRNRKAWLIDHTLYVSSRNDGTRPLQSPNPKEFHEMQWNFDYGGKGRLVEEHNVILTSLDRPSEPSPPGTSDTLLPNPSRTKQLRHSLSRISIIDKIAEKLGKHKKQPETEQRRRSWMPSSLIFETGSLSKEKRAGSDDLSIPLPRGRQIPNAMFARKFLLVDDGDTLPPYLSTNEMPTAESKAIDTIVEAAASGLLDGDSSWSFRGPFTPQLGYDGGLDYRWGFCEPNITVRRFDVETPVPETPKFRPDPRATGADIRESEGGSVYCRQPSKRGDTINDTRFESFYRRNPLLFENIEFTIPKGYSNVFTPTTHRKTTVVERSDGYLESSPCVFDADYPQKPGPERRPGNSLKEPLASRNDFVNQREKHRECFEYMHMGDENQDSSVFDGQEKFPRKDAVDLDLADESQEVVIERLQPLRYHGSIEFQRQCLNNGMDWSPGS
ncbi:hypothetical protein F4775DRAFT_594925 [Biscogniauxia sp. FL1348]|nr:hypothetical protein F4775DRAFT_594925 [Biscogniauxia sp. FL1348]